MAESFIYAIQSSSGFIKIGFSKNPNDRLKDLQIGTWDHLQIIGFWHGKKSDEAKAHLELQNFRHRGEWFYPSYEVSEYIRLRNQAAPSRYLIPEQIEKQRNIYLNNKSMFLKAWTIAALICGFFIGMQYGFWIDDKIQKPYKDHNRIRLQETEKENHQLKLFLMKEGYQLK